VLSARVVVVSRQRLLPPGPGALVRGLARRDWWARLAHSVMRRPVLYIAVVLAVLTVLALPFGRAQFGGADERVMPAGTEARLVTERIAAEFPGGTAAPIETLVEGASNAQAQELIGQIRAVPGITGAQVSANRGDTALVSVGYTGQRTGDHAYAAVQAIGTCPHRPASRCSSAAARPRTWTGSTASATGCPGWRRSWRP